MNQTLEQQDFPIRYHAHHNQDTNANRTPFIIVNTAFGRITGVRWWVFIGVVGHAIHTLPQGQLT